MDGRTERQELTASPKNCFENFYFILTVIILLTCDIYNDNKRLIKRLTKIYVLTFRKTLLVCF
jgi:hypothetical protein